MLKFDIYLHEKAKKLPEWMDSSEEMYKSQIRDFYRNEENIKHYLPKLMEYSSKQISRMAHLEVFPIDFTEWIKSIGSGEESLKIDKKPL